jgi:TRAP-type mannitol/chloroaromatic compound transport system permease small subunit
MKAFQAVIDRVGSVSNWSGKLVSWINVVLIITISYDVIMRYVFNAPTDWSYTLSYMLGATMFCIGQAYVQRINGHVRVDLLYVKFSPRTKLLLDVLFTILFFLPTFFMVSRNLWINFFYAFHVKEKAIHSTWYPLTWPYKLLIAIGFTLFFIQGLVRLIQDLRALAKGGASP